MKTSILILLIFLPLFQTHAAEVCSVGDANDSLKAFLKQEKVAQSHFVADVTRSYQAGKAIETPISYADAIRQKTVAYDLAKSASDKKDLALDLANTYRLSADVNAKAGNSLKALELNQKAADFYDIKALGQKVIVKKDGDVFFSNEVNGAIFAHMRTGNTSEAMKYIDKKDYMAVVERMHQNWLPESFIKNKHVSRQSEYNDLIEKFRVRSLQLRLAQGANNQAAVPYITQIQAELPAIQARIGELSRGL